jgi:sec-independent protein translocase protein TatB
MFEFDAAKLVIVGIVALIVIGPKDFPRVLRQAGQMVAKLRSMAAEFQGQFMEAMREAELAEIKVEAEKVAKAAEIDASLDPVAELQSELTRAIDAAPVASEGAAGHGGPSSALPEAGGVSSEPGAGDEAPAEGLAGLPPEYAKEARAGVLSSARE